MKIKEAIAILKKHNLWRRDRAETQTYKMVNPTQLGIAIDVVVAYFEKDKK